MNAFEKALGFVLDHEGRDTITDDPRDPGGLTKWGICASSYPGINIRALTEQDAAAIYRRDYWDRNGCGNLPPEVAVVHFDACVNQGPDAATKMLQQSVGVVADGAIGPKTLAAVQRAGPRRLAVEYAARRALRYAGTANVDRFGLGWMRRLTACLALALAMED